MSSELEKEPEHVEANRGSEPSDNPLARGLNITVSIPETVEIRTVNASVLADYEVWSSYLPSCLMRLWGLLWPTFKASRLRTVLALHG